MKNKHLADLERLEIEHALRQRTSLKKIADKLGKHHSTLSREIRSRRIASDKGAYLAGSSTAASTVRTATVGSSI